MPQTAPTWPLHAVAFNKISKLERVDASVRFPSWQRPKQWYFNCGDLQTSWGTRLTELSEVITQKKYPPPLSVWQRDQESSSRLAEVCSLKRNITPGYFHSSRLQHRSWRWRCKHAVDVLLRQLVTWTRVVVSPVSFRSSFPHVGIHNCAEKPLSCVETLSLQTTCTFVQQLQGWMTGRSDSDVMHTCNLAKTPPWTCVLFLGWLHFEYL